LYKDSRLQRCIFVSMKLFKFGGASVNSVERIKNLVPIINFYKGEKLIVIVSAIGKTTNALEKVAEAFFAGKKEEALGLFEQVKQQHLTTAKYILVKEYNACYEALLNFFTEVEWLLHDKPVRNFDYYYDQIVCCGELLSTSIISFYLREAGIANEWIDVRDVLRTDNNFRDAGIIWGWSSEKIKQRISNANTPIVVTQGFIGATDDNESTTLGREGSDYTAAVFANILDAEHVTIWKDVAGVMNADPKVFPDAELMPELNFTEVIEMAYYGAQVIHPKTIKPLQNKGIPLLVKCFLDTSLPGTIIHQQKVKALPPVIVIKQDQVLMHLTTTNFSFVGDEPMSELYQLFSSLKIKPNLIQTGAISVQLCFDNRTEKIDQLAAAASRLFDVQVEKNLALLTIRHHTKAIAEALTAKKEIILQQQTPAIVQYLYRS
jgi:aspartate kinase